jgi:L-arabinonolactonase
VTVRIDRVGTTRDQIGESPWWDAESGSLSWVDSACGLIRTLHWNDHHKTAKCIALGGEIGSVARRADGGFVVAASEGFLLLDGDGGSLRNLGNPESEDPRTRFNDGKTDRSGAFLAGTMIHDPDGPAVCGLYRLSPDYQIEQLETGWRSSNGPCFSPDGSTFYFADSLSRIIYAYDYHTEKPLRNKRPLIDVGAAGAIPDGASVDTHGCLWSCFVTAGKIARITPDGRIDRLVDMPVPLPASVMFGGPDLDILFVTSIAQTFGGRVADNPLSGGLFAIEGLGVCGIAETRFSG